jgi:ClpP class serine protease
MVRTRREGKLKGDEKDLFSGSFWTGAKAKDFGLVDGLGDMRSVCIAKYGKDVEFRLVQPRRSWLGTERAGVSVTLPTQSWSDTLLESVEDRALWARFGL